MTEFLVKSNVAMAALLGLYYVLFEREKMHHFKRFYLLSALAFSFTLPFITVMTYITEVKGVGGRPLSLPASAANSATGQSADYLLYIAWAIYAAITLILAIRFIRNIRYFVKKASGNPSVIMGSAKLVLLEEKVLPHTFLSCIFVNREDYNAKKIEDELYTHEYTHVKQKHTLDILFIEVLRILFWFNPLLYCYKKAIQLNHEFLADEKVIDSTTNAPYYQNLLLEKAALSTTFSIASNLTFSLTKKRLVMMTKTTSAIKASLLKMAIVPVIAVLMSLYCTKTIAQETIKKDNPKVDRVDVTVPTASEFDALKEADPIKYAGNKSDYLKTTISYAGKTNDTVYYDRKTPYAGENKKSNLSIFSGIDPNKLKSIDVMPLTELEKNTLKKQDPEIYSDTSLKDYMAIKATYINNKGELQTLTAYENKSKR